jgi:Capsule polysaccharide biosynthesis protein
MLKELLRPLHRRTPSDPFLDLVERYRRRIRKHRRGSLPRSLGAKVGVLVSPWQQTAVPFYLIEWAICLRRQGLDVEFIWDVWPNDTGNPTDEEKAILLALETAEVTFGIPIVISSATGESTMTNSPRLALLAFENITRNRGREPQPGDPDVAEEEKRLRSHAGRVERFIAQGRYTWMLVPGGVWAVSGVYWDVCQTLGIGLTTFDSGPGLLCFQHGGPAAHFPDLNSSMQMLAEKCAQNELVRRKVEECVDERLSIRRKGEDDFHLQPQGETSSQKYADIVVPLNYRLDTAAMCRQRLFSSINDWMQALVNWAKSRPDVSIAFRQHPCEKIPAYRSKEDYSWISERSAPNIRFIGAEDSVNTYDLLRDCRVVLPYSSRVGIEASVLGKPVILAASAYYERMAFAQVAHSKEAYFDLIEMSLKNPVEQTFEQRCSAYAAYYVAETFGLHKTNFTPIPSDFESWVDQDPAVLWSKERASIFLKAAISRKPVADLLVKALIERWAPQLEDSKR